MLTQEQVQVFRDRFVGKRVSVKDDHGEEHFGVCQYLGYNPFLPEWGFQVTLDRTPVRHCIPSSLKEVDSFKRIDE